MSNILANLFEFSRIKKKLYESSKLASILDVYTISEIRKNNNLIRSGDLKKTWKLPNAEERWKMLKLH